ncbi:MAG TPA: DUF5985 family protein [Thermoanaerobaculia bacterium]|nr:DUF5985 family protein [Thermoanaerobaculia bacterium]
MTIVFLSGVLTLGYAVAALYFLRFWRESRDPLFGWFAAAFALLACQRLLLVTMRENDILYVVRLAAFIMILVAIVLKNRSPQRH